MFATNGNGLAASNDQPAKNQTKNALNSIVKKEFAGTDDPRQLRAITMLMTRPLSREALDIVAGASNGPALVSDLRSRGLEIPCERIDFIDRDGKTCLPGVYSLTDRDRRKINNWQKKRDQAAIAKGSSECELLRITLDMFADECSDG